MDRVPLSVLVATKNEERNLDDCLRSAAFADEVVVVDSGSVDRTVEIAADHGAAVVRFPGVAAVGRAKRTWAIDTHPFRNEWILVLDADERVGEELQAEIAAVVAGDPSVDAFRLAFRYIFMGRWIRHCGWYPAYQVRLFRRGRANYEPTIAGWTDEMGDVEVHERIVTTGSVGELRRFLLHYDYKGVGNWVDKHNRYSTWEAGRRVNGSDHVSGRRAAARLLSADPVTRRRGMRQIARHVPCRPFATFVWMYLVKRGFLDGYPGLVFCAFHSMHQWHIDLKVAELIHPELGFSSSEGTT